MKGLLLKDFYLLKNMKNTCMLFFVIALILLVSGQNVGFVLGYTVVTSLSLIFNIHTLDTMDNGEVFLMTLPVERKYYAMEKYLISYISVIAINVIISAIIVVTSVIRGELELKELMRIDFAIICMVSIFIAIMLPVNMKFGVEKGRILMVVLFAGFMGILMLMENMLDKLEHFLANVLQQLDKNPMLVFLGTVVICVVINAASMAITVHIVKKKEF